MVACVCWMLTDATCSGPDSHGHVGRGSQPRTSVCGDLRGKGGRLVCHPPAPLLSSSRQALCTLPTSSCLFASSSQPQFCAPLGLPGFRAPLYPLASCLCGWDVEGACLLTVGAVWAFSALQCNAVCVCLYLLMRSAVALDRPAASGTACSSPRRAGRERAASAPILKAPQVCPCVHAMQLYQDVGLGGVAISLRACVCESVVLLSSAGASGAVPNRGLLGTARSLTAVVL